MSGCANGCCIEREYDALLSKVREKNCLSTRHFFAAQTAAALSGLNAWGSNMPF